MAARPVPKCSCQIRLASTRASKADGREPGLVSQRAKASRRPVEPGPAEAGSGSIAVVGIAQETRDARPDLAARLL